MSVLSEKLYFLEIGPVNQKLCPFKVDDYLRKSSLTGPEPFMVVFSHEKEEDFREKKFGNSRKNFTIYEGFDSRKHKLSNISKSSSFRYFQNSSKHKRITG